MQRFSVPQRYRLALGVIFIFCYALAGWRTWRVPIYGSEKGRDSIHGDAFDDRVTHSAARWFADSGFCKTALLPVTNYDEALQNILPPYVYVHYPALAENMAGLFASVTGSTDPRVLKLLPLGISVLWFLLIFHAASAMLPDKRSAFLSAAMIALSTYFLAWADNLNKHMYESFFSLLYVYWLWKYFTAGGTWRLWAAGFVFVLAVNVSYEPAVVLAVVTLGMSHIYTGRAIGRATVLMGTAAVLGIFLHLLQNRIYLGSWDAVLADLRASYLTRTVGAATSARNELGRSLTWKDYLGVPLEWLNRPERFFLIPGWAMAVLMFFGYRKLHREDPRMARLLWFFLFGALAWSIVMTQHFLVHIFTVRNLGLFYLFAAGYGLVAYWDRLRSDFRQGHVLFMALHIIFSGYILAMAINYQVWDMYIRNGFAYPHFGW